MEISIHFEKTGVPLIPYWSVCVGGGRVGEAMRADFQKHLEMMQREAPFQYIRMHGLFHEDMMVYREVKGAPVYNWQYVDLVFDHWLSIGIRPFVELGFMPYDMASGEQTVFWWKANVTPPKDWSKWEDLVEAFVRHVIGRYGVAEVLQWYFEVWNEPNIPPFWKDKDFDAYMELYARSARAIKKVHAGLKVGGPASAGSGPNIGVPCWGERFLKTAHERGLPVDFFSTHPYPTFHPMGSDGEHYMIWDKNPDRILPELEGIEKTVRTSPYPDAAIHLTEWSSSPGDRDRYHDCAFMCAFIVHSNWLARGKANSLSFWTISDIVEENRIGDVPFHGGFGLVTTQGLKKASCHGYWFLSQLGEEELASGKSYCVTRKKDGSIRALFWNYCYYNEKGIDSRNMQSAVDLYELFQDNGIHSYELKLEGIPKDVRIQTTTFDREHGSSYDAWVAMGSPNPPTREDLAMLKTKMELDVKVSRCRTAGGLLNLSLRVPSHGVTLIVIAAEGN